VTMPAHTVGTRINKMVDVGSAGGCWHLVPHFLAVLENSVMTRRSG